MAGVIRRKPVLQANLNSASLARGRVGERQDLLAAPHGAYQLLLLLWIAVAGLLMLRQNFLLFLSVASRRLDCGRAGLADHHFTASVGFWTLVRFA